MPTVEGILTRIVQAPHLLDDPVTAVNSARLPEPQPP
jgi:hypothetical protein